MTLTFVHQIEAVARRIQRRRWATAACWAFTALAAAMLGLIALDRFLGVYHIVGRVFLTALLAVAVIAIGRQSRRAVRGRTTPLDVALELERQYPEYHSLLASGLQFSQQEGDDPTAGSLELRRAVVLRASLAVEAIDLETVTHRALLRRAAIAALVAFIVLADLAAVPQGLATGVVRLLNPLSDAEWPRRHDLAFVDPPRLMPVGGDFQTELRDRRGALPRSVEVEYRTQRQGRWRYQSQTYTADGDAVEVRWPNVQESFEYRARGGDHESMPWRRVDTAPAPQVESLEVTVQPPAYTGLSSERAAEPVRVIAGSELEVRARTSLPVTAAKLQAAGQAAVELDVSPDGDASRLELRRWEPTASAEWSLALTTPAGMTAIADRGLSVGVSPDRPPTVAITEPAEDLAVLAEAAIDNSIEADDDLAVRSIQLSIAPEGRASANVPPTVIDVWAGPKLPAAGRQEVAHLLELSQYNLAPGTQWEIRARAEDYAGQKGRSPRPLRLQVITRDEFSRRMDALVSRLRHAMERGLGDQQEAYRRVDSWQTAARDQPAVDDVLAALSRQRQVAESLGGGQDSAIYLGQSLVTEYRRNKWPDEEGLAQIEQVVDMLNSLKAGALPSIESSLAELARNRQQSASSAAQQVTAAEQESLAAVRGRQQEVIAALESAISGLSHWSEVQQYQRELSELKSEQAALLKHTEEIARQALQRDADKNADDVERLREQALGKQRELAARLASTLGRMRQTAETLAGAKPADAARLDAVVAAARRERMQKEVQAAAEHLAARRLSQAAESQRKTEAQLAQILDQLAQRGLDKTSRSKQEIERLDAVLGRLVAAQQAVVEETLRLNGFRAADGTLDPARQASLVQLAKRQAAVREQSAVQADQIEQFPVFARLLRSAADTMQQAEGRLSDGDTGEETAQLASRAHDELRRLADAVHQQRQQQSQPPIPSQPQPPKVGDDADGKKNDPDQVQALQLAVVQLGLLRTMQADLQERTKELEQSHAAGEIDDEAVREQTETLAAEQRELTELAATLVRGATVAPRDEGVLPELDEELRRMRGEDPDSKDLE